MKILCWMRIHYWMDKLDGYGVGAKAIRECKRCGKVKDGW